MMDLSDLVLKHFPVAMNSVTSHSQVVRGKHTAKIINRGKSDRF